MNAEELAKLPAFNLYTKVKELSERFSVCHATGPTPTRREACKVFDPSVGVCDCGKDEINSLLPQIVTELKERVVNLIAASNTVLVYKEAFDTLEDDYDNLRRASIHLLGSCHCKKSLNPFAKNKWPQEHLDAIQRFKILAREE